MSERLTWTEIEARYDKEWVELVDYDWPDEEPDPRSGVVRVHAKSREDFDDEIDQLPPVDSALVFVGKPNVPDNQFLSTFNTVAVRN